jgi:aerobic-type carbon monoxide dehydrogenase small subunit (CoxS/CutS family)
VWLLHRGDDRTGAALLEANPHPDDDTIRRHMAPNLCRCGTHVRILAAIKSVIAQGDKV